MFFPAGTANYGYCCWHQFWLLLRILATAAFQQLTQCLDGFAVPAGKNSHLAHVRLVRLCLFVKLDLEAIFVGPTASK
jgi:hypothetical protein